MVLASVGSVVTPVMRPETGALALAPVPRVSPLAVGAGPMLVQVCGNVAGTEETPLPWTMRGSPAMVRFPWSRREVLFSTMVPPAPW